MEMLVIVVLVLVAALVTLWWRRRGQDPRTSHHDPHSPRNDGGNRTHYGSGAG